MKNQTDGLLVQRALRQFSPDVFLHPVWVRFAASAPLLPGEQIQPLILASKQMLAERDMPGACSVLFLCAARQTWLGDYSGALESISQVLKLAKRHHLTQDAIWGYWGAGAIYAQHGEFQLAAVHLRNLQALIKTDDWVLADLVEMIAQTFEKMSGSGAQSAMNAASPLVTNPFLQPVLRALFQWGQVLMLADAENISPSEVGFTSSGRMHRWRKGWQRLLRWLLGDLQPGRNGSENRVPKTTAAGRAMPFYQSIPVSGGFPVHTIHEESTVLEQSEDTGEDAREGPPGHNGGTGTGTAAGSVSPATIPFAPGNGQPRRTSKIPQISTLSELHVHALRSPALTPPGVPALAIYFFGSFRLYQDDLLVADWPGQKSLAIFKYLAANRGKPVAKDILMDYFWADAETEVARRNLHQAIYALRQVLKRGWPNFPSILFENDCYLLNHEIDLWLDFEAFDKYVQSARRLEEAGKITQAVAEYGIAQELYPGDFLEDDLYEEWPTAQRTYYRTMYLDLLDRLCRYYLEQKQYYPAIILCQKILAKDNCAEQAYRSLIYCYLAQGQRQLAIREYQTCVQVMKQELNLAPSEETRALYALITSPHNGAGGKEE